MLSSSSSCNRRQIFRLIAITSFLHSVYAYSWSFQQAPTQCGNVSISISGDDGVPPYHLLIVPFGAPPLPNGIEPRQILDVPFSDGQNEVEFQLTHPTDSQFIAVVSDSTGFGSGGTSVATMVQPSNDGSCFDSTTSVNYDYFFDTDPENQLVQCQDMRIWYDPTTVQGAATFLGVIPGGQSFTIPQGELTSVPSQGLGFTWTPSVSGGTTLLLVGGDARGNGTAGRTQYIVSFGTDDIVSCLSTTSPSSTLGSPAGSIPTFTSPLAIPSPSSTQTATATTPSTKPSGGGGLNTGILAGFIILGVAIIVQSIILVCCLIRKRDRRPVPRKRRTIDEPFVPDVTRNRNDRGAMQLPLYIQSNGSQRQPSPLTWNSTPPPSNAGETPRRVDEYSSPQMFASTQPPDSNRSHDKLVAESSMARRLSYTRLHNTSSHGRGASMYSADAETESLDELPAYRRTGVGIAAARMIDFGRLESQQSTL